MVYRSLVGMALCGLCHASPNRFTGILAKEAENLREEQQLELNDIMAGKVSKSEIEVVLAQYDEDVSWSDAYSNIRTVYCKGGQAGISQSASCVPLPNVGREGHTFLHHIVKNYDNLAEWTVFSQASEPTPGYKGHRAGGGHMLPGVSFHDYVLRRGQPEDNGAFFVYTGKVKLGSLGHSMRLSYTNNFDTKLLKNRLSQPQCPKEEDADGWEEYWDLGWFKNFLGARCGVDASRVGRAFTDYWETHLKLPRPENDVVFFAQGARFAASRARIWQRPKAFYEQMLQLVSGEQDPCANYFNEWLWHYMIGAPQPAPCAADKKDAITKVTRRLVATDGATAPVSGEAPPPCYVTGLKWTPKIGKETSASSPQDCMTQCYKNSKCAHFTYDGDGKCSLADAYAKASSGRSSIVSGPPNCDNVEKGTMLESMKANYTILRDAPEAKGPISTEKRVKKHVGILSKLMHPMVLGCTAGITGLVLAISMFRAFTKSPDVTSTRGLTASDNGLEQDLIYAEIEIEAATEFARVDHGPAE